MSSIYELYLKNHLQLSGVRAKGNNFLKKSACKGKSSSVYHKWK